MMALLWSIVLGVYVSGPLPLSQSYISSQPIHQFDSTLLLLYPWSKPPNLCQKECGFESGCHTLHTAMVGAVCKHTQVPDHYTYRYQVSEPDSGVYRDHMEFRNGGIIHGALSIVRDDARVDIKYKGLPWKGWEAFVERSTPGLPLLGAAAPGGSLMGTATPRDSLLESETVPHRKPVHSYLDLKEMEERLRLYYHNNHVHVYDKSSNGK